MSAIHDHKIDVSRKTGLALLFTAAMAIGLAAPIHADNPDTWVVIYFSSRDKVVGYDTGYFANTNGDAFNTCEAAATPNPDPHMSACGLMLAAKNTCGALVATSGPAYNGQLGDGFNFSQGPTRDAAVAAAMQRLGHQGDVLVSACSRDGVAPPPAPGAIANLPPDANTRAGTQ
jgi:hypothetical protein